MKKIFSLFWFSLFVLNSFAQYWEKTYFPGANTHCRDIIETDDKGVLILMNEYLTWQVSRTVLIKTNVNGEILWKKTIGDITEPRVYKSRLALIDDKILVAGLITYNDNDNASAFLMLLDECAEVLWTRNFINKYDELSYSYIMDVEITEDDKIVVLANYLENNRVSILKMDIEGKTIWQNNYLPNGYDADIGRNYGNTTAFNITATQDKGFLLGGDIYVEDYDEGEYPIKSFVLKVDAEGTKEWVYVFGVDSNYYNNKSIPIELKDSSIFVMCTRWDFPGLPDFASYAYKLSKDGVLLEHKLIGDSTEFSLVTNVELVNDSTIWILKSIRVQHPTLATIQGLKMEKLDLNGNVLDTMYYRPTGNYKYIANEMNKTFDSKMLICGFQEDSFGREAYVLKVQADLSIDTFSTAVLNYDYLCSEPILSGHIPYELTLSIINVGNVEYELKVYPNPSQSYIYFEIEADESLEYGLNIYDALGGLVYKQNEVKDKLFKVNVVDLSSGIYYYSIDYKNELVGSGKFVKQ